MPTASIVRRREGLDAGLAGGPGFEPGLSDPKSDGLPLADPPADHRHGNAQPGGRKGEESGESGERHGLDFDRGVPGKFGDLDGRAGRRGGCGVLSTAFGPPPSPPRRRGGPGRPATADRTRSAIATARPALTRSNTRNGITPTLTAWASVGAVPVTTRPATPNA